MEHLKMEHWINGRLEYWKMEYWKMEYWKMEYWKMEYYFLSLTLIKLFKSVQFPLIALR